MKKFITSRYFPFILYSLFSILFLSPILVQNGLPFKYDWGWPIFDLKSFLSQLTAPENQNLMGIFSKDYLPLLGILGYLGLKPVLGLKLFLILIHTLSGLFFYLFIRGRVKNQFLALLAGLAYAFSPYIFIRTVVGFISSLVAYAFLPLFIHLFCLPAAFSVRHPALDAGSKIMSGFRIKSGMTLILRYLALGLTLSLVFSQSQAGVLVGIWLIVYCLISLIYKKFWPTLKRLAIIVLSLIVVNSFWIYLYFVNRGTTTPVSGGAVTTLQYIGNLPHSLRNVLMLSDHLITRDFFYSLARDRFYLFGFILIYLIAFLSIFYKKERYLILSIIVSTFIIIPFSIGPTGHFAKIYTWVFNHFSYLALFRETYHFEIFISFALITLFAFGADWLLAPKSLKWLKLLMVATVTGGVLFIIAPYLTFNYAGYFKLQQIPKEYSEFRQYLTLNPNICQKIYYPPNLGFIYFKGDDSFGAANSDLLAGAMPVKNLFDGASVLNVANKEMFYRNHLTSQFLEQKDAGEFASLFSREDVDCLVVRDDVDTKYDQVSDLWRDPDLSVRQKWFQSDMLVLAKSKVGLEEVKRFGDKIYLFKNKETITKKSLDKLGTPSGQDTNNNQYSISNTQTGTNTPPTTDDRQLTTIPITDFATDQFYYRDGWSRGRYAFWRKNLFATLEQDFIYTSKSDSIINGKIDQRGSYELWARYLTGGTPGETSVRLTTYDLRLTKDPGEERFEWKDLGTVDIIDGNIKITNISGENAVSDLVLVKK